MRARDWLSPIGEQCKKLLPGGIRFASLRVIGMVIAVSFLTTGCINIKVRIGIPPNPDILEKSLHMGESNKADVLAALGPPFGKGRAMLPIDPKPKTLWSYYYEEGDMKDMRRIFLFVFFDQDRYDGYMWFSSLPIDVTNAIWQSPRASH
jgi:hypothetical protein